ncbi:GNAT family N-acetyltransferase [Aestuariivita boseongensis]|uniref:GNAT family N-acetyltransferase n=1 Tax=Aestuariivita boseongensis TaxID=1470562 RepID=UPI0006804318|nr:GNAT family N-acetyltransferase [Aestuariivita boseongensis]
MHQKISEISGKNIRLRLVSEQDAAFIHALRTAPMYSRYLSPVTGSVEDQRKWIAAYKSREAAGAEYYYVIERLDGHPCGVVRLYELTDDSFTWGSWILNADKPSKAAFESAVLSFSIGFDALGLYRGILDVRRDNAKAIAFYRRFGMTETGSDADNLYFELTRERFAAKQPELNNALQEGSCSA